MARHRPLRSRSVRQTFAPDQSRAGDAEVVKVFAPQQRVVPVIMPIILVGVPRRLRLGSIVQCPHGNRSLLREAANQPPQWCFPAADAIAPGSSGESKSKDRFRRETSQRRRLRSLPLQWPRSRQLYPASCRPPAAPNIRTSNMACGAATAPAVPSGGVKIEAPGIAAAATPIPPVRRKSRRIKLKRLMEPSLSR